MVITKAIDYTHRFSWMSLWIKCDSYFHGESFSDSLYFRAMKTFGFVEKISALSFLYEYSSHPHLSCRKSSGRSFSFSWSLLDSRLMMVYLSRFLLLFSY
ncbi:hypothetical protein ACOSQ2_020102 [Xanthoceras sorbifolium]